MLRQRMLTTFILLFFSTTALSLGQTNVLFDNEWTYLASIKTDDISQTYKDLSQLDIDVAGVDVKEKVIDVLINHDQYKLLEQKHVLIWVKETKGVSASPDDEYKDPEEIERFVKYFSIKYPNLTKLVSIGKSIEGRDIWAIKISDNPEIDELDEPTVLFNSMHHAREVMSPEVSIDIIQYLLENYNQDQKVTDWVNKNQIWILPMFNVDGNNKMWNDDKWWRKNTRGGYGVDLNRNYPAGWNKCNGSSSRRSSDTYRGPSPGSEPETQAMMNFVKKIRPVFDISYHSYSELVIYPLGCRPEKAKNKEVVEEIGRDIAKKLNYTAGTAWELLYNADGGDIDWMYETYQVIPFVIELNSRREGFHPSYFKWRDKTVLRNRVGWQYLLDRLEKSGVRGRVYQEDNIVKDFIVKVYDKKLSKYLQDYKSHQTGIFHIVLNPGEYKIEFIKQNRKIFEKEIVIEETLIHLDINL